MRPREQLKRRIYVQRLTGFGVGGQLLGHRAQVGEHSVDTGIAGGVGRGSGLLRPGRTRVACFPVVGALRRAIFAEVVGAHAEAPEATGTVAFLAGVAFFAVAFFAAVFVAAAF